ncbi:MAG: DUF721 domain-containing protein [Candidatus Omnitrophica bacterium]|nr:DUF721 domain-containing protein [Candidatus Omnitrophota bacterium]
MSPKKSPIAIKDVLLQTLKGMSGQCEHTIFAEEIRGVWKKAAGEAASNHSTPTQLRGKTLVVNVDSPIWIYQLNINKEKIEKKLSKLFQDKGHISIKLRAGER